MARSSSFFEIVCYLALFGSVNLLNRKTGKHPEMIPTILPKIDLDSIAQSQLRVYFRYQKNLIVLKEASQCAHPATVTYRNELNADLEEAEALVQIDTQKADVQQKHLARRDLLRDQLPRITALVERMKGIRLDTTTQVDKIEKGASSIDVNFRVANEPYKMVAILGEGGQGTAYMVSHLTVLV